MSVDDTSNCTLRIMNSLMAAVGTLTVKEIVGTAGVDRRRVSPTLRRLAECGRVSTASVSVGRREYWLTAAQRHIEATRRSLFERSRFTRLSDDLAAGRLSMTPYGVQQIGVAILSDPARLAGRLIYLERLLARPVFAEDATMQAIARDYRTTLAAVHSLEEAADNEKAAA